MKTYEELTKSLEERYKQKIQIFEKKKNEERKNRLEKENEKIIKKLEKELSEWSVLRATEGKWMSNVFDGSWTNQNVVIKAMEELPSFSSIPSLHVFQHIQNKTYKKEKIHELFSHIDGLRINTKSFHSYIGHQVITKAERLESVFEETTTKGIVLEDSEIQEIENIAKQSFKELLLWVFNETESLYPFYKSYFRLATHKRYLHQKNIKNLYSIVPGETVIYSHMNENEAKEILRAYQDFLHLHYAKEEIEQYFQNQIQNSNFEKIDRWIYVSENEKELQKQMMNQILEAIQKEVKEVEVRVESIIDEQSLDRMSRIIRNHEEKWKKWYTIYNTIQ